MAESAPNTMNFNNIKLHPLLTMWAQQEASLRKSGVGNVFIKNLHESIDDKYMYDIFSVYGSIRSCKVATDEEDRSKGYGYVHFEMEEAANNAILNVNGMVLAGRKVYVGKFIPREEREKMLAEKRRSFRNVYVKNFPQGMDDDTLQALFEKYGKITSAKVMMDEMGKSEGFGFVSFEDPENAQKAVDDLNGKDLLANGKFLYVGRAQKKRERQAEQRLRIEMEKQEHLNRYQGMNLYVKNLDNSIDDERLRKEFDAFGTITSVKVMMDGNGHSKRFGFVCFSTPEEAAKAVLEMNGRIVLSKPLYVALSQTKKERKAHLASQYMQRMDGIRMQQMGHMFNPVNPGHFVPTLPQAIRSYFPPQMPIGATIPRWTTQLPIPIRPSSGQPSLAFQTIQLQQPGLASAISPTVFGAQNLNMSDGMNDHSIKGQQRTTAAVFTGGKVPTMGLTAVNVACAAGMPSGNVAQSKPAVSNFNVNKSNPGQTATVQQVSAEQVVTQQVIHNQCQELLISPINLQEQKQRLGEFLFPTIYEWNPEFAEYLSETLLEIDRAFA